MGFAGLLLSLFVVGTPIAVALLTTGLVYLAVTGRVSPLIAAQQVVTGIDSFPLLAIPFFFLAAELMNQGGITDRIYRLANCLVGGVPGGLAYVNIVGSTLFAAMSGSATADSAGMGRIEARAMLKAGYARDFSAALSASTSTLAPIIPPSISLVIYGVTSGASIGGLFVAGIVPGLIMALTMGGVVYVYATRRGFGRGERFSLGALASAFRGALLPLGMPALVMGGIWGGIFTATEAGAFAVLYALLLGLVVYRTVRLEDLAGTCFSTALASANVLFIIAVSAFIGWLLSMERVPFKLAMAIVEAAPQPWVFLLGLNVILLVLGCFMAAAPVIIMLTPIILPITSAMGIDPIHLGVVMVLNLMIGLVTPPVGLCLFVTSEVYEIPVMPLVRAIWPFLLCLVGVLLLITFVPEIVLFLPRWLGYVS